MATIDSRNTTSVQCASRRATRDDGTRCITGSVARAGADCAEVQFAFGLTTIIIEFFPPEVKSVSIRSLFHGCLFRANYPVQPQDTLATFQDGRPAGGYQQGPGGRRVE